MAYELLPLPFDYGALEPYIDEKTMRVHHDGHHQTYTDKLNSSLSKYPELQKKTAEELIDALDSLPEEVQASVKNFGGGFVNHNFLWQILKKEVSPQGEILKEIEKKFGSFDKFKEDFSEHAMKLFGSGYTWLVLDGNDLEIINLPNQDSPLSVGKIPLLTIDMWEHAYYLKHQNKKANYINDFFNVINWEKVNEIYLNSLTKS